MFILRTVVFFDQPLQDETMTLGRTYNYLAINMK